MTKDEFVGHYLDKKMKKEKFSYPGLSMEYYGVLTKHTEAAEKIWERKVKEKIIKYELSKKYPMAKITFK